MPATLPTARDLEALMDKHRAKFHAAYRRKKPGDFLVFGDLDRVEVAKLAAQQLGRAQVEAIRKRAARERVRPMVVLLQPSGMLDQLARTGDPAHAATARELRAILDNPLLRDVAAVLFTLPGGMQATKWTPPESGTVVVRV